MAVCVSFYLYRPVCLCLNVRIVCPFMCADPCASVWMCVCPFMCLDLCACVWIYLCPLCVRTHAPVFPRNGGGRSGTFCTCIMLLEMMRSHGMVDVFYAVKTLRDSKPNMVESLVGAYATS